MLCFCDKTEGYKTYDWWQQSIVYQIYPLSFKDSNGDGYGDINGIIEKLDYIKDIGVDIIWVQPFYKSPMLDLGYDVADYRAVDSLFGTLDDFKNLIKRTHEKGNSGLTCPEDYGTPDILKEYLGNETHPGAQIAFYNRLVHLLTPNTNSSGVEKWVRSMIDNFPEGYYNWVVSTRHTNGFTKAKKPWVPVNPNYYRMNVNAQRVNPNSHLNIFKRLVQLRRTPVIRYGDLQTFAPKEWIFMFTRSVETETVAVVMNIGSETEEVCAQNSATALPDTMFVYTSSMHSGFSVGYSILLLIFLLPNLKLN
ncbi:unnamed protein product [Bemisia tabaci]|uniref:Glycosyl hydrolase family 13 catalytic domain-containing protein n=1 Tax=Bemisia tabaci TaxID=7038 RepID=A0A9P0AJQ7_BEMTA|nr:unnamed protein product [Bemisia tabaci]